MTRFHLIRHGETDFVGRALAGRMGGVSLTAAGRAGVVGRVWVVGG